jgi:hypothetical protein
VKGIFKTVSSTILFLHTNSFFLDRKIFAALLKVPGIIINWLMVASIRQMTKTVKNGQKHNTISVGHQYAQKNTNNVNKT